MHAKVGGRAHRPIAPARRSVGGATPTEIAKLRAEPAARSDVSPLYRSGRPPRRPEGPLGHFVRLGDNEFAGTHLIIDLWGGRRLGDLEYIESAMRRGIEAARATLLHIHLHHFGPGCGVTGVAVLSESHISVHTWPEREFAAFDVFMCGESEPARAMEVLTEAFQPRAVDVSEILRGAA